MSQEGIVDACHSFDIVTTFGWGREFITRPWGEPRCECEEVEEQGDLWLLDQMETYTYVGFHLGESIDIPPPQLAVS